MPQLQETYLKFSADGTTQMMTYPPGQQSVQYFKYMDQDGRAEGEEWEGAAVTLGPGTGYVSLGGIQLNNVETRMTATLNVATGGSIPAAGIVLSIAVKTTQNCPWFTAVTWAQLQALGVVNPILSPSNTILNIDVTGLFAVDVQASMNDTGGGDMAVLQLYAGVKRKA